MPAQLLPFLAVVGLITVTPGPDTALVVRNTLQSGLRHGAVTAIGCSSGLLVWGAAASLGLATIFSASSAVFSAIRIAGGVYLAWLGLRLMWQGRRKERVVSGNHISADRRNRYQPFVEGLLTDLLNPKAAAFFTALLPQFLVADDPVLATTLFFATLAAVAALAGLLVYAAVAARARAMLGRPLVGRALDQITGAVLFGLGLRMLARDP